MAYIDTINGKVCCVYQLDIHCINVLTCKHVHPVCERQIHTCNFLKLTTILKYIYILYCFYIHWQDAVISLYKQIQYESVVLSSDQQTPHFH